MRIDILTLFPEIFPAYLDTSIINRAREADLLEVLVHNIRDFARGKHRITDEAPFGGGGGMILKPGPIFRAAEKITGVSPESDPPKSHDQDGAIDTPIFLLTPQGRLFDQQFAKRLAGLERFTLICGRYEGVDERVRQHLVDEEISIGDFVLTGGELAALIIVDAVTRLLPGALGATGAAEADSHAAGLLEGPHYTRPAQFRTWTVPDVLLSGHAVEIKRWRRQQALRRTWERRPELLLTADLDESDRWFLMTLAEESAT